MAIYHIPTTPKKTQVDRPSWWWGGDHWQCRCGCGWCHFPPPPTWYGSRTATTTTTTTTQQLLWTGGAAGVRSDDDDDDDGILVAFYGPSFAQLQRLSAVLVHVNLLTALAAGADLLGVDSFVVAFVVYELVSHGLFAGVSDDVCPARPPHGSGGTADGVDHARPQLRGGRLQEHQEEPEPTAPSLQADPQDEDQTTHQVQG